MRKLTRSIARRNGEGKANPGRRKKSRLLEAGTYTPNSVSDITSSSCSSSFASNATDFNADHDDEDNDDNDDEYDD